MQSSDFTNITQTAKFKAWFTGSKVVNKDGTPKKMYHGTNAVFNEFYPLSHFGTAYQATARIKDSDNASIIPVYLCVKNPLRVKDYKDWGDGDLWQDRLKDGSLSKDQVNNIQQKVNRYFDNDDIATLTEKMALGLLASELHKNGYDGLVYNNEFEGPGDSYIIFFAKQVIFVYS